MEKAEHQKEMNFLLLLNGIHIPQVWWLPSDHVLCNISNNLSRKWRMQGSEQTGVFPSPLVLGHWVTQTYNDTLSHPASRGVCSTQILLGYKNVIKVYFLSSDVLKIGSCIEEIAHNLCIRRNGGFAGIGGGDQFY
jgi:hypothetical protein